MGTSANVSTSSDFRVVTAGTAHLFGRKKRFLDDWVIRNQLQCKYLAGFFKKINQLEIAVIGLLMFKQRPL